MEYTSPPGYGPTSPTVPVPIPSPYHSSLPIPVPTMLHVPAPTPDETKGIALSIYMCTACMCSSRANAVHIASWLWADESPGSRACSQSVSHFFADPCPDCATCSGSDSIWNERFVVCFTFTDNGSQQAKHRFSGVGAGSFPDICIPLNLKLISFTPQHFIFCYMFHVGSFRPLNSFRVLKRCCLFIRKHRRSWKVGYLWKY